MYDVLLSPHKIGGTLVNNRVIMAPMTRNRAEVDGCPNHLMVEYYAQRASAGLIIAEGTYPSFVGQAYSRQPGIVSRDHIIAWKKVTQAVHAKGGKIYLQIMHAGRVGSYHIKGKDIKTVGPSIIPAKGQVFTDTAGLQPFDTPIALTTEEVYAVIKEHKQAAINAKEAGFDGVELHCTSGYLPMQFLCTESNDREDEFGGSVEARCKFILDCLLAMSDVFGSQQVGIRINPGNSYNDCPDANSELSHIELINAISPLNLGYLHMMRSPIGTLDAFALAKTYFSGAIIVNDGFSPETANTFLEQNQADAVSFARHFVANPDLVERIKLDIELSKFNRKTLYTPGAAGYTDYPSHTT